MLFSSPLNFKRSVLGSLIRSLFSLCLIFYLCNLFVMESWIHVFGVFGSACLRQEIFRFKKLAKKSMIEVCENPVDSHLEQSVSYGSHSR